MKRDFNWRDYDEYQKWLEEILKTLDETIESQKTKNDNQAKMLQEIFNIVYSDDNYEKQVKQVRDVLLGKGE
jgi:uncharacterized protein with ATP-grasp and redox domains